MPPEIVTWADPAALAQFREDIAALRSQVDVVIASHHWGLDHEVLNYQVEIAHTAIDVGADLVMGHGPPHAARNRDLQGQADLLRGRELLL
jgi:poly-gamma-glutamate synthesis protein (capsule biosynthesis protein)